MYGLINAGASLCNLDSHEITFSEISITMNRIVQHVKRTLLKMWSQNHYGNCDKFQTKHYVLKNSSKVTLDQFNKTATKKKKKRKTYQRNGSQFLESRVNHVEQNRDWFDGVTKCLRSRKLQVGLHFGIDSNMYSSMDLATLICHYLKSTLQNF